MQLEALKIYCDVVRLRSFSRGAQANDVLQSSASQAVQNIEETLGVSLIDRSCRPWELTDEGKLFYDGCREVIEKYDEAVARVRRTRASGNAVIRVAAIYSVNMRDMTQRVQEFSRQYAGAKVEVDYAHPDRVLERVLNDEVELGIISYPDERDGLTVIPWHEQQMVLVCHPQSRFARLKSVEVKQLKNETFVGFDTDLVIAKKMERFLKDNGIDPNVAVRFDNIEAAKRAVEAGSGCAILPLPTLEHELKIGTLAGVPFSNARFTRPLGIIHRKGRKLYPNTEAFIEVLKDGTNLKPAKNGNGSHGNGALRKVYTTRNSNTMPAASVSSPMSKARNLTR
jgi:DNA-binding transcriptional LysR family regulator